MTSTEYAPFWSDLGDHIPDEGTIPPPYAKRGRLPPENDTRLTVRSETFGAMVNHWAEYTCPHHHRVSISFVDIMDSGRQFDLQVLPRLVLTLHAWRFACDCFRLDWEAAFGEQPNRRSLIAARRWALDYRDHEAAFRLDFAVRNPIRTAGHDRVGISSAGAA